MAKQKYLVGKAGDLRFKRKVPAHLRSLAGKDTFVISARNLSASELKEVGNKFAYETDLRLQYLQQEYERRKQGKADLPFELSFEQAEDFAARYVAGVRRSFAENFPSRADEDFPDRLADAADDVIGADEALAGIRVDTDLQALRLLEELGWISTEQRRSFLTDGWPVSLSTHPGFQYLCRLMRIEDAHLTREKVEAIRTGLPPRLKGHVPPRGERPRRAEKTVGDLIAFFRDRKVIEVSKSRFAQFEIPVRALREKFGEEALLSAVTRDECRALAAFLVTIPPYVKQRFPDMTLEAAAASHAKQHGKPATRESEADKHVRVLRALFQDAVNEGWIASNPWEGLSAIAPRRTRKFHAENEGRYKPFSVDQLNRIFAAPIFQRWGTPDWRDPVHYYWAPLIALFSGMRMNEILQLEASDVCDWEGVPYFAVTDQEGLVYDPEEFSKRLKTKNSLRNVPIHPMLEKLGFLRWVATQGEGRLFPQATTGVAEKPSDKYSKRFAYLLKSVGVWEPRKYVFHSFRHTFTDALRDAGVSEEMRRPIEGWQNQKNMDARYGRGHTVDRLYKEVCKAAYHGLKLEHLTQPKIAR